MNSGTNEQDEHATPHGLSNTEARHTDDLLWTNAKKHMKFNSSGRMLCKCGKGFACEDTTKPAFTKCGVCYKQSLTRRELKALGLKR